MSHSSRKTRIAKWVGLGLVTMVAGFWADSAFTARRLNVFAPASTLQITSTWGFVSCALCEPAPNVVSGLGVNSWDNRGKEILRGRGWGYVADVLFRLPACERIPSGPGKQGATIVDLPFGLLFTVAAVPTALLWWRARTRIGPNGCQQCGYNLTGNVSGVCPECGSSA